MIIEYRLVQKKIETDNYSLTSLLKEKPKLVKTYFNSHIPIMESILQKLIQIDSNTQLTEYQELKALLMMYILLYEINTTIVKLSSWASSPFYEIIRSFNTSPLSEKLSPIFKFFFEDKRALLESQISRKEFCNEKLSRCFGIEFRDPLTIAGNSVPEFHRLLIKCTPFLVDFPTRLAFYKQINSHVSRSLYYIYHVYY